MKKRKTLDQYPEEFRKMWEMLGPAWRKASLSPRLAFASWEKLSDEERELVLQGIPLNIAFMEEEHKTWPTRRYCSFVVWVNQARWEGLIAVKEEQEEQIEHAKTLIKERAAKQESEQHVLEFVIPVDERRAKIANAHAALIRQQRPKIDPVVEKCREMEKAGRSVAATKAWGKLRAEIPYLPAKWQDLDQTA